jgi:hypothetical protein
MQKAISSLMIVIEMSYNAAKRHANLHSAFTARVFCKLFLLFNLLSQQSDSLTKLF